MTQTTRQKESSNIDGSEVGKESIFDAGGHRVATQIGDALTNVLVKDKSLLKGL